MAFTLIDGVIANDTFATPAIARTFVLLDGLTHSQFNTAATATNQPVDAVLGLTTWSVVSGSTTGSITTTQSNNTAAITGVVLFSGSLGSTQNSNIASLSGIVTSASVSGTITVTQANNTSSITGIETFVGTISSTQANNTTSVLGNETFSISVIATQASNVSSITASERFVVTVATTQANDVANVTGTVINPSTGVISTTQADNTAYLTGTNGTMSDLTWGPTGIEYYFLQAPYSLELATGRLVLPLGGSLIIPL